MTKTTPKIKAKDLQKLGELLAEVSRATELRPAAERQEYVQAQRSVVEAKRKAELRAGQLRIA